MGKTRAEKNYHIRPRTRSLVYVGMFTAVMIVLSQLYIPMPTGVPVTLQTFAVALTGAVLGWKKGVCSTVVYVLLGVVGVPVFSGFGGGLSHLLSFTGGFIYGFPVLTGFCGVTGMNGKRVVRCLFAILGVELCHLAGVTQFVFLTGRSFWEACLLVSLPYQLKDILFVIVALAAGGTIRKRLFRAGLLATES